MLRRRLQQTTNYENLRFVKTAADTSAWNFIDESIVFTDPQDAIDDCPTGGQVIIAKGTYHPQRISHSQVHSHPQKYLLYPFLCLCSYGLQNHAGHSES